MCSIFYCAFILLLLLLAFGLPFRSVPSIPFLLTCFFFSALVSHTLLNIHICSSLAFRFEGKEININVKNVGELEILLWKLCVCACWAIKIRIDSITNQCIQLNFPTHTEDFIWPFLKYDRPTDQPTDMGSLYLFLLIWILGKVTNKSIWNTNFEWIMKNSSERDWLMA